MPVKFAFFLILAIYNVSERIILHDEKGYVFMKNKKGIFMYVSLIVAAYILIRYYPVQLEVVSNAWEDDISIGLQYYFDVGDGFTEEDSINTYQRNISNKAYVVKVDSSLYEQASQVRINFIRYSQKLYEDTKALNLDAVVFKKMGIPFFSIREFESERSYLVDAVWEEGKIVIKGRYPSIVLTENILTEFQNQVRIINAVLLVLAMIIVVAGVLLWKNYLKGKVCFEKKFRILKKELIIQGQAIQPFLFVVFFFINYFMLKSVDVKGDFLTLIAALLLSTSAFLYREGKDGSTIVSIIFNYGISLILVSMQKNLGVYFYIPIIVVIVCGFGKMSLIESQANDHRSYNKLTKADIISVTIMIIAYAVMLCYRLEANPRMTMDETYALHVGGGILQTGDLLKWDFVNKCSFGEYGRAWIFYTITAFFYKVFGINIIVARAVSAVCGVLFVPIIYYIFRKFYSRNQTILSTLVICFNPSIIIIFRTARMYSLVLCVSMALIYCCFKAIVTGNKFKHNNCLTRWIKGNFDYNIKYLAATLVLLFVSYIIHINTIILVIGFALFVIIQAVSTKEKKYITASGIICIGILAVGFIFLLINKCNAFYDNALSNVSAFSEVITLLSEPMEFYFWNYLSSIGGIVLGIGLTLIFLVMTIREKKEVQVSLRGKWNAYILILEVAVLFVFIFMANHYAADRYAIFILPIVLLVITQGYLYLCSLYQSKIIQGIMVMIFLTFSIQGYQQVFMILYQGHPGASDYEKEAAVIAENTEAKEIALYASSFSPYHYQMFDKVNIAKYFYDEEASGSTKNIEDFIKFARENGEGYVTIERRNLTNFPLMTKMAQWMTQIGGLGYDSSNIDIFNYHFISENTSQTTEISFEDYLVYEGITFRLGANSDKLYLEVIVTGEDLLNNEFIAIKVKFDNDNESYTEGYQLYMGGSKESKNYLIELKPGMEEITEYSVLDIIGICDSNLNLIDKKIAKTN